MQKLKLIDELMDKVDEDIKHVTIREGMRDIVPGELILESTENLDRQIIVNVIFVTYCKLAHTPTDVLRNDGFLGQVDLVNGMTKFYPDITGNSIITCITWEK